MTHERLQFAYFDWLCRIVTDSKYAPKTSMYRLLTYLHQVEFTYDLEMDASRASDGVQLRYIFDPELYTEDKSPCSVLEMMIALARKCEFIMENGEIGDRTANWFWSMIETLGLSVCNDRRFDTTYVDSILHKLLSRAYEPDGGGNGSLFYIPSTPYDLRQVEIWYQMCWWLDTLD